MKFAITSDGADPDAQVDSRFGRCAYFVIYDTEDGSFTALKNEATDAASGAGVQAARIVEQSGARVVLTGQVGPKAEKALQAAGIEIRTGASGTLREAAAEIKA